MLKKFGELKVGDKFKMVGLWLEGCEEYVWVKVKPIYPLPGKTNFFWNSERETTFGKSGTRFDDGFKVDLLEEEEESNFNDDKDDLYKLGLGWDYRES